MGHATYSSYHVVRVGTVWMTSICLLASSSSVLSTQPYLLIELKVAGPGVPVPLSRYTTLHQSPYGGAHSSEFIQSGSGCLSLGTCSWCCLAAERKEHWSFWQGKEIGSISTPYQSLWNEVSLQESKHHLSLETCLYFFSSSYLVWSIWEPQDFYSLDGDFTSYEVITLV